MQVNPVARGFSHLRKKMVRHDAAVLQEDGEARQDVGGTQPGHAPPRSAIATVKDSAQKRKDPVNRAFDEFLLLSAFESPAHLPSFAI